MLFFFMHETSNQHYLLLRPLHGRGVGFDSTLPTPRRFDNLGPRGGTREGSKDPHTPPDPPRGSSDIDIIIGRLARRPQGARAICCSHCTALCAHSPSPVSCSTRWWLQTSRILFHGGTPWCSISCNRCPLMRPLRNLAPTCTLISCLGVPSRLSL